MGVGGRMCEEERIGSSVEVCRNGYGCVGFTVGSAAQIFEKWEWVKCAISVGSVMVRCVRGSVIALRYVYCLSKNQFGRGYIYIFFAFSLQPNVGSQP